MLTECNSVHTPSKAYALVLGNAIVNESDKVFILAELIMFGRSCYKNKNCDNNTHHVIEYGKSRFYDGNK